MAYQRKRPEDRIGNPHYAKSDPRNDDHGGGIPVSRAPSLRDDIPIPDADPKWKLGAQSWFRSLKLSGQSQLYEASDWAMAVSAAGAYDLFLRTYNASIFAQFVKLSEKLAVTHIDRKRARIELAEPEPTDADEDAADATVRHWAGELYVVPGLQDDGQ